MGAPSFFDMFEKKEDTGQNPVSSWVGLLCYEQRAVRTGIEPVFPP
jgi:hypothetical protein